MIDHTNCTHPRTRAGRAACRRGQADAGAQASTRASARAKTPALDELEVWSQPKIRQEALRRASAFQAEHPLDVRSFAEIHRQFTADLRDRYSR